MERARYLFMLAHFCHLSPAQVDDLTVMDFWQLVTAIISEMNGRRR